MVKKTDEGLVLNNDAKKALDLMLRDLMFFTDVIKKNENIKKFNKALVEQMEIVAKELLDIRAKIENGKMIEPQELAKVVNDLNRANDSLNTYKFEDSKARMLGKYGQRVMPDAKSVDEMPAQKEMNDMQASIKETFARIQRNAEVVVRNAQPKHRSLWKRFIDACVKFAKTCKNKFLSIFGKEKKAEVAPKAVSYKEAHMEEIKNNPVKRQGAMAAAAAAAKAKRAAELRAEKEENNSVQPPQRPARPPRKL